MKKVYCLILTATLLFSCTKDFLETVPYDFLAPETYYQTEEQLNYAKAGVYHHLGTSDLWGTIANYLLGFSADEGYMNRASLNIGPWNLNHVPTDSYNLRLWRNLYYGINRANVVLANVDNNKELSQSFRDQVRGEVLLLRSYYYFLLVQHYGAIPLKTGPTVSVEDVDSPNVDAKTVYKQIIQDMTEAEKLVKDITEIGHGGQVSKSAVRGLLARVNLYMAGKPVNDVSGYAEAKKWAKMVMDDAVAGHSLNPDFPKVFINYSADAYDIKESIWEVEFWGNRQDSYVETGNLGWHNGPAVAAAQTNTGRADAYMYITSKMYNIFEPGDLRKFWSIAFFTYNSSGANGAKTFTAESTDEANKFTRYPAKWRREYEVLLPKHATTTPQNFPLLRYSDVLLMYAEAENELNGPTSSAIAAVNQVRQRAWATGIKSITVTNGGSGYASAPTVSFSGNGGAEATSVVANGALTAINLTRDAATFYKLGNYSSAPTVTITGGGGSGAQAVAEIYTKEEANLKPSDSASKESFRKLIMDERMRELNFEGMRKSDLIRWGIFVETMQDMGNVIAVQVPTAIYKRAYSNAEPKHLLMPIPSSELTVNEAIKQNPGWE